MFSQLSGSMMLIRLDKQGRFVLRVPLDVADKYEANTTRLNSWLDLPLVPVPLLPK